MELFPINIATGMAFCNRIAERSLLKVYIKSGRPVVIIAPRRYGKTSLVNQVLLELKLPCCIMELTMATSLEEVEQIILQHVSKLLYTLLPRTTKAKQNILKLFRWLNPELVLTAGGQKLIFHPERSKLSKTENVAEILQKLDQAAVLVNKKVVVVMDEFQQLSDIQDHTIEASIRHAMQYSKQVSYIFLGSNRHMLLNMFNNKNRPFYNSCEIIKVNRILENDYVPFIQRAAHKQWGKPLSSPLLEKIFELSELHPSYINRICGHFWAMNEFPTLIQIERYWQSFIDSKRAEFTEDILNLSKNQKKVLAYLAHHPTLHLSSYDVCQAIGLSEASIRQAVKNLMVKDYICKDDTGINRILDPAFKGFIKNLD
jgi:AAA+ ATPase superfamily predicted ATPase